MKKYSQVSNDEKVELFQEFCEAVSLLDDPKEIMNFMTDLLTEQEVIMISKRIKIAGMLLQERNYQEIQNILKVSPGTISRINQWLSESGEGFRVVFQRTKRKESKKIKPEYSEFKKLKRRYPIMFWPQLLIEDIVKTMNAKQKEKIKRSLKNLDRKSQIYKQIDKALK